MTVLLLKKYQALGSARRLQWPSKSGSLLDLQPLTVKCWIDVWWKFC